MNRPPSSPSRRNYEIAPKMPKVVLKGPQTDHIILIEKVKHFSFFLYLGVRVGEGRQLIFVKTEKSGEKEKGFSIFFSRTILS